MRKIERLAGALARLLELPQHRLIYRHMETAIQDHGRANVLFEAKGYGGTEQFNIEAAIGLPEDAMLGILRGSVAIDPENAIVADLAEDLKDATLVLNQQIKNGLFNGAEG